MNFPDPQDQNHAQLQQAKVALERQLEACTAQLSEVKAALAYEQAQRAQAERAYQDAEVKFRAVAQSANDAIIAADSQGRITFWNRGAQTIFGYTEGEALGQPLTILMPEAYKTAHQQGLERVRATGETHLMGKTVELQGLRKDNHEFPLELSLATWLTGSGPLFSGIIHDVSDRKQAEQMLAEQEHLVNTLIGLMPDYIYVKDTHNGHQVNNIAHVRVWGEQPTNGDNGHAEFDPLARELTARYYAHEQEVIRTGQPLIKEDTVTDPGGGKHWLLTATVPLRDGQGQINALVGVSRDITERKRIEEERDHLFTLSLDLLAVAGLDGLLREVNPAWATTLGYTKEILLARPFLELIHPADQAAVQVELQKLAAGLNTVSFEVRLTCADGSYRWTSWNVAPLMTHGLIYGIGRDITARKQAEEALAEERKLLRTLINNLPDYIYVKDTQSRFILLNEAAARQLGVTAVEEAVGKTDFDFSPLPLTAEYYAAEQQLFHSGQPLIGHEELTFDHATGTQRWVLTTKVPFCDSHGQVIGLVGMNRDITERKLAEEEKARLLEAVSQQHIEMQALATRLAEVQESERQQLARELHDQVGQNLSALGFNLNFICTQVPSDSPKAALIAARLNDSLALVEQTTERVRDVMAELRPPMLDDYGLMDTLDWYADRFVTRAGLAITIQGDAINPRLAPSIENALFRIAQEALTNIAKHAHANHVLLSLETTDQLIRMRIADNGAGFAATAPVRRTKRQGWGLRLMAERAEMVGGKCWIESIPGHGTCVIAEVHRAQETSNGHYHLSGG